MRRLSLVTMTAILLGAAGCGGSAPPESDELVPVERVPPVVMRTARKQLPGFKFDTIYKMKVDGKEAYEVRGKDRSGKSREVEVTATGVVLSIE